METRTHRKRNKPQKTTGNLRMNDNRRENVIEPLTRYARLSTRHLEALYGSRHIKHILKKLWHEASDLPKHKRIFNRPDEINRHVGTYLFHELEEGAFAYTDYTQDFIRRTIIGKQRRSAHDTHICMIVADFEAELEDTFISHLDILSYAKCPPATLEKECPISFPIDSEGKRFIEPDALIGHALSPSLGKDGYKFYAVELDRMTESLTVIDRKIAHWTYVLDRAGYQTELGLPNMRIMWITHSKQREANIRARVTKHHDAHLFNTIPIYHLYDNAPEPNLALFGSEWRTARGTTRLI